VTNLPTSIKNTLQFLIRSIRQEEEIKEIQISKEKVKLCLFTNYMIIYLKDPKNLTKKLLDIINSLSKVAGYKINLQKSVAILYTNNEKIEKEYRKTIPLTSKKIKYLGINLTNDVNCLYKEKNKPLKKEIEEDYKR
jgi:hypothetical protein